MLLERKKKNVQLSESSVIDYKSKVDYFKYTDNPNEAKELLNLEHQVIFCTGKIEELREKRWESLTRMRTILKKEGIFKEVMGLIGISKDMVYDINNREKIYLKCEINRKEISKLSTRVIRDLAQDKTLDKLALERIIKAEVPHEEYKFIKKQRMENKESEIIDDEKVAQRLIILDKINWHKAQIKMLEKQYDNL